MRAVALCGAVWLAACGGAGPSGGATARRTARPQTSTAGGATHTAARRTGPRRTGPQPAIFGPKGHIALRTLDGRPTTLAAHGAKVTVVALWATFCGPCMQELPMVDALYRKYRGRSDVSVMAVNIDDTRHPQDLAHVRAVVHQLGLTMPCLVDGQTLMERLAARGPDGAPRLALPLLVVIDPAFVLRRHVGFYPGTPQSRYVAQKSALIDAILAGRAPPPVADQGPPRGAAPSGSSVRLHIPALSDVQRAEMLPRLRARLEQVMPQLGKDKIDALMQQVETASQHGGDVTIPVP